MGMFGDLMGKVFGIGKAERPHDAAVGQAKPGAPGGVATAPQSQVDIEASLNQLAAKNPEKLDWKHSIVDLMKLVGMDSSLSARKELADDLNYTGDKSDSAKMNMWLHKEVMRKLAENGGKVPPELMS
ncbi:MAG: DUF3597 domain-containing protein [Thermoanaerobaculia bacterium]